MQDDKHTGRPSRAAIAEQLAVSRTVSNEDHELTWRRLRYGVASVYSKQCGYVLNDVESANRNMRLMLKVVDASALDAEGTNKGRYVTMILSNHRSGADAPSGPIRSRFKTIQTSYPISSCIRTT